MIAKFFHKVEPSFEDKTKLRRNCIVAVLEWILVGVIPSNLKSLDKTVDLLKELRTLSFFEKHEIVEITVASICAVSCRRDPTITLKNILRVLDVFSTAYASKKIAKLNREKIIEYASVLLLRHVRRR